MEIFDFSYVEPIMGMDFNGTNRVFFCQVQVEVDDAVTLIIEFGEDGGFKDVYPIECQFFIMLFFFIYPFITLFVEVFPANEQVMVVEEQFACGFSVLGKQPGLVFGLAATFVELL